MLTASGMAIITLTTDFGTRDGYVGAVKGVLARLAPPETALIDIAHDLPRGDIAHAAWVVNASTQEYPYGSIHLVVVDPGVGGARREVIVWVSGQWYVGPDNGVLTYVADTSYDAWAIEARTFRGRRVSPTFHGRDLFAHAAAALARGEPAANAGPVVRLAGALPWGPRAAGRGRVVHVDHYGNLITDLPAGEAGSAISIDGNTLRIVKTYSDVPPNTLLAYVGSMGTIEVAVRDGRADTRLAAPRGTPVVPVPNLGPYR
jgi:S-adenosylmethionine hydrolase